MTEEKRIEEMAKDLASSIVWQDLYDDEVTVDTRATSVKMRDKGYRKASDVAREIICDIETLLAVYTDDTELNDTMRTLITLIKRYLITAVKEKYTEGEE